MKPTKGVLPGACRVLHLRPMCNQLSNLSNNWSSLNCSRHIPRQLRNCRGPCMGNEHSQTCIKNASVQRCYHHKPPRHRRCVVAPHQSHSENFDVPTECVIFLKPAVIFRRRKCARQPRTGRHPPNPIASRDGRNSE
jgi:hypothetical protein